ncbi:hypothetical protein Pme01_50610 [Planosporangium mesophilum]|uniref:Uncharacterized protein n=1 Tax=Planosporangium mesophilum TaxID=689768 RepID=A0A8J3TFS7_9ACTN|nr:hypothetical protein Pme01_50610 [Planosporangium mesophilum]
MDTTGAGELVGSAGRSGCWLGTRWARGMTLLDTGESSKSRVRTVIGGDRGAVRPLVRLGGCSLAAGRRVGNRVWGRFSGWRAFVLLAASVLVVIGLSR